MQRTGKQGAVYNGGTKDQCSNVNQHRTGFDAVSAILGIRRQSSFEGEASTALQFAAEAFEQKNRLAENAKQSSGSDVIAKSADENDAENLFTDTIIINALNTLRKYLVEQKQEKNLRLYLNLKYRVC